MSSGAIGLSCNEIKGRQTWHGMAWKLEAARRGQGRTELVATGMQHLHTSTELLGWLATPSFSSGGRPVTMFSLFMMFAVRNSWLAS